MKKLLMMAVMGLLILLFFHGNALARGGVSFGFGIFVAPPALAVPAPGFHPYPVYHHPPGYWKSLSRCRRIWIPGHRTLRRTPLGWEKIWVPGHWDCR